MNQHIVQSLIDDNVLHMLEIDLKLCNTLPDVEDREESIRKLIKTVKLIKKINDANDSPFIADDESESNDDNNNLLKEYKKQVEVVNAEKYKVSWQKLSKEQKTEKIHEYIDNTPELKKKKELKNLADNKLENGLITIMRSETSKPTANKISIMYDKELGKITIIKGLG